MGRTDTMFICSTISARGREGEGASKAGQANLFYALIVNHITNYCCFVSVRFYVESPKKFFPGR